MNDNDKEYSHNLDEFKLVLETTRQYFSYFVTFVSIYLASLGIFLSIFFNDEFIYESKNSFMIISNIIHLSVFFISLFGNHYYTEIAKHGKFLCSELHFKKVYFDGPIIIGRAFLVLVLLFIVIWNVVFYS